MAKVITVVDKAEALRVCEELGGFENIGVCLVCGAVFQFEDRDLMYENDSAVCSCPSCRMVTPLPSKYSYKFIRVAGDYPIVRGTTGRVSSSKPNYDSVRSLVTRLGIKLTSVDRGIIEQDYGQIRPVVRCSEGSVLLKNKGSIQDSLNK